MKNNKGFSLIEIMTVVIILGILASLSIPFVLGYVRDARNDRAKSVLYVVAQGFKNFRSDFSNYTINSAGPLVRQNSVGANVNTNSCETALSSVSNNTVSFDFLIKCSFLPNLNYSDLRYNFYLGNACSCGAEDNVVPNALACMVGNESAGSDYDSNYCAYIDLDNNLREVRTSVSEEEEEEETI